MRTLWLDLRSGFRALWQNRLVSALAIVSLALALAGNTVVFSAISAMFLRPLPFDEPEELVFITDRDPANAFGALVESKENWFDIRDRATSFESLAAFDGASLGLESDAEPEPVSVVFVTPRFFNTLRWEPALGRAPHPEEEEPGAPPTALLSHRFWSSRFASDPEIVGSDLHLSGERYRVIGVLPEDTEFLDPSLDVFSPIRLGRPDETKRDNRSLTMFGRLDDGVSIAQADQEMRALSAALVEDHPRANRGRMHAVTPIRDRLVPPSNRNLMGLMQSALILVLLIACANVANLLLAQGQQRGHELAVRAALGAGRRRLFSQLVLESVALALLAFGLGAFLAWASIEALRASLAAKIPGPFLPQFDFGVLMFTAIVTSVATLLFSLTPALRASKADIAGVLQAAGRSGAQARRRWLAKGLVVGQIVLAVALLTGSVILADAVEWLQFSSPGFQSDGLIVARVAPPAGRYESSEEVVSFFDRMREGVEAAQGVSAAAFVSTLPRSPFNAILPYSIAAEARELDDPQRKTIRLVATPGYFKALGVSLLEGRDFSSVDHADAPKVAVVNTAFARRHWPDASPLGERIRIQEDERTVVGVVSNVWQELLAGEGDGRGPIVYLPHAQAPQRGMALVARTTIDVAQEVVPGLRAAIWDVEPKVPQPSFSTFDEYVGQFFGTQALGFMMNLFGGLALLLAAVGIYGVIAFSVGRRTHEIGLRMALGAGRGQVMRMIAWEGVTLLAVGLALGAPVVILVAAAVESSLQGLVPTNPVAAAPMLAVLVAVALLASYLPARRAARLEPVSALRDE